MTIGSSTAYVLAVAFYFVTDNAWAYDTRLLIRASRKQDWASGFSLLTSVAPSPLRRQATTASKSTSTPPLSKESDESAVPLCSWTQKHKVERIPQAKLNLRRSSSASASILLVDYFSSTRAPPLQSSSSGKGARRSERSQSDFQTAVWRFWTAWRAAFATCETVWDAAAMLDAAASAGLLAPRGAAQLLPLQESEATTLRPFTSKGEPANNVPGSSSSGASGSIIAANNLVATQSSKSISFTIGRLLPIEVDLHGMSAPMAAAAVRLTLHRLHCTNNFASSDYNEFYTSTYGGECAGGDDFTSNQSDLHAPKFAQSHPTSTNALGGIGLVIITGRGVHSADGSTRVRKAAESVLTEALLGLEEIHEDKAATFGGIASEDTSSASIKTAVTTQPAWRRAQDLSTAVVNEGALWVTYAAVVAWLALEPEEVSRRLWGGSGDST